MPIRLIVADMDDTLLTGEILSERTLSALSRARERGAYTVLASGRMVESMLPFAAQAQVNAPIIAYNGGVTYDTEKRQITHQTTIPKDVARELCFLAESMGLHVQGYQDGGYFFEEHNHYSEAYAKATGIPGTAVQLKLSDWIAKDQFKVLVYDTVEKVQEVLPVFKARFEGRVNVMTSKPYYLELIPPGADKGVAVRALAERLCVPQEQVAAFGDGLNDIGMLRYAARGYAMHNANEQVRAAANHLAPPSKQDGVAQVIEQLLDQGEIG